MSSDIFDLQGSEQQRAIVADALARCNFPFELLAEKLRADTGRERIPVEWADLSRYNEQIAEAKKSGAHAHIHEGDDTGHPIEARERVLGLAWYSGKVSIDALLVNNAELAKEVFLSEGAHMVDFFYMTDAMRKGIFNALHGSEADAPEHGHDWFDEGDYFSWAGEAFMGLFVRAFSNVQMTMPFDHPVTPYAIDRARELLMPAAAPPAPEPEVQPYFAASGGKTFHDSHKGIKPGVTFVTAEEARSAGLRPCKVCRPVDT